jgi:hypothetical protein
MPPHLGPQDPDIVEGQLFQVHDLGPV